MASSSSNLQDYVTRNKDMAKGLSDTYNLPANQYTVMSVLSAPKEMPYKKLCKTIEALPEHKRLSQSQIDGTLYELIRLGYLSSFMENGDVVYMVLISDGKLPDKRDEQLIYPKLDFKDLRRNFKSSKPDSDDKFS